MELFRYVCKFGPHAHVQFYMGDNQWTHLEALAIRFTATHVALAEVQRHFRAGITNAFVAIGYHDVTAYTED